MIGVQQDRIEQAWAVTAMPTFPYTPIRYNFQIACTSESKKYEFI